MSHRLFAFLLSAGLVAAAQPAAAHHPSTGGSTGTSGPINVISASTLEKGQGAAAVLFELIKLDALSDHTLAHLAEDHVHAHSIDRILSPSLVLAYGFTNDLTVSARLPFVRRDNIREGHHEHVHGVGEVNEVAQRGDTDGVGDLTLLGQYRFFNNQASGTEIAGLLGIKAPTGRTGEHDDHGELFEAEFQPGSGSWDGLFGLAFSQRLGVASVHASALYSFVTEGTQDTDLGDRLHYGVAISYRLGGAAAASGPMYAGVHSHRAHRHAKVESHLHHVEAAPTPSLAVDLILELNGEWAAKQQAGGVKDDNSGGHSLYLSPGIRFSYDKVSAFATVGVPFVNDLNGYQAEPDWRLFTGVAMSF